MNEKDINEVYPVLLACNNNNIEMIKLLIEYANKNNIILKLNEENESRNYALLLAFNKNNTEMAKLFFDYADKYNIILNLNNKSKNGNSPLYGLVKIIILKWLNY